VSFISMDDGALSFLSVWMAAQCRFCQCRWRTQCRFCQCGWRRIVVSVSVDDGTVSFISMNDGALSFLSVWMAAQCRYCR
jgi:hypothetical protein